MVIKRQESVVINAGYDAKLSKEVKTNNAKAT